MTLHQLEIFLAVAKHLNVTRAADDMHINQPSVSQQLKLLEENCGVKLYKMMGRKIELTKEGRLFLNEATAILAQVKNLKELGGRPIHRGEESLTIAGSHTPSMSALPLLSAIFKQTHPDLQITLCSGSSPAMEEMVLKHEVDLAWIGYPSHSPMIIYDPFRKQRLTVFAPAKHPLAKRGKLALDELARFPLIVVKHAHGGANRTLMVLKHLQNQGVSPNVIVQCESFMEVKSAVKAGSGLGILYQDISVPDVVDRDLKVLDIPELKIEFDTFIIYHKERPLSPSALEFLTLLKRWPRKARWLKPF